LSLRPPFGLCEFLVALLSILISHNLGDSANDETGLILSVRSAQHQVTADKIRTFSQFLVSFVVMDEPTNFLDREALGALSAALNNWGGAVLMISHNKEFYSSVCTEEWMVEDGRLYVSGVSDTREMKAIARKKKYEKEVENDEIIDKAGGNVNAVSARFKDATINFWGQAVSKKEARAYEKAKKKGDIPGMRKVLQVPAGKIMPGFEELGDGKTT
jgi:ABC-type sugar transport system ATPase subunit